MTPANLRGIAMVVVVLTLTACRTKREPANSESSGRGQACPTPRNARSADYREVVWLENRRLSVPSRRGRAASYDTATARPLISLSFAA